MANEFDGLTPVTGNTFPVRAQLAALGGKYQERAKTWFVPVDKAQEAYALVDAHTKAAPRTKRNKEFNHGEGWTG